MHSGAFCQRTCSSPVSALVDNFYTDNDGAAAAAADDDDDDDDDENMIFLLICQNF